MPKKKGHSPVADRMLKASAALMTQPDDHGGINYAHASFASAYLPRKKQPASVRVWTRESGVVKLRIEAGGFPNRKKGQFEEVGLPFGACSRLILIYFATEAMLSKTPEIEVGKSLREFMLLLGYTGQGSDYKQIKDQLKRLAAARVQLWFPEDGRERMINEHIVREWMEMWREDERQGMLWQERIVLSDDYFFSIKKHGVPLSLTALRAIRHSPLALDIYQWLAYRLHRIDKPEGVFIRWDSEDGLRQQFGLEVADRHKFRSTFRNALEMVHGVYPATVQAVSLEDGGVRLFHAAPPIPKTTTPDQIAAERRQLLKEAKERAAQEQRQRQQAARGAIEQQHRERAEKARRPKRAKRRNVPPPKQPGFY